MDVKKQLILFTLPNLNGGGAERVIINIIKSLDRDKFDIKLLLIDKIGVYFEYVPEYVEIISLDVKRVRNALPKLIRAINDIKPDIIFSTLNRMNILVLLASYFIDKNIKLYVREPNLPSAQIKNNNLSWWYKMMIKILYPRAYKIVAQTDEMNEEIHRYFGIKKEKIITFINPIDKETIDKNLQNAQNPFEEGYENFVAVGRLSYQKGFDLLIEAFSDVVKENNNYRLYILGEGEERKNLEKLINKYNLGKNVFLEGFQSNPHKYIKYAKAFILSSRWEGLPNVVLESLYIGTPVVMTKVNEYCERLIVENGFGVVTQKEITGNDLLLTGDMKQPLYKFVNDDGVNEIFYK
jgi:glycosyltransferase involved in cell wall biosynthesis